MAQKYFIFAMGGAGKTYITQHYKNAHEIKIVDLKWTYGEHKSLSEEDKKCHPAKTVRAEYPQNLIDAVFKAFDTYNVVMMTMLYEEVAMLIDVLSNDKSIEIILAYPELDCYEEYKQRWISRGNSNLFLETMADIFYMPIRFFQNLKEYQHLVLKQGEFLDEALKKYGIELVPKDAKLIEISLTPHHEAVT